MAWPRYKIVEREILNPITESLEVWYAVYHKALWFPFWIFGNMYRSRSIAETVVLELSGKKAPTYYYDKKW